MSLSSVQAFFAEHAPDIAVIELAESTATVAQAAAGHGVEPAQIAKTLAVRVGEEIVLIVTSGHMRLDNKKFRALFSAKPRMLELDAVERETGHPVGGVCPFGLARPLPVYCDLSLKEHAVVVPAAGAIHAAVHIAPERLAALTGASWIDVCSA
ncbi:cys-tRNA(pro)/cys-tRNA(cys) deacylase [Rhizobium rhizosphaerae]|uniref:Cys-tRNA(Pro)/cys-tRNA(Cys) deacylase n=1 Tax=Xaviernesmea rhizosphaerae TaxID=1672749 RepID=A0A1Q9AIM5_9HYPH|nr:YbaK/EbsC family protein [Xaviernesmea rhizosphaerae]OLP55050.1 cys-tRNA(pro)/cys-tRNA(cys) deacylase [Xaviernesmea rhizosphaerae]OQP85780.1 cys-tRNA(pro)/cys-tRNA(cys) deacylase [Xaviernesmea rhizosphaerae]